MGERDRWSFVADIFLIDYMEVMCCEIKCQRCRLGQSYEIVLKGRTTMQEKLTSILILREKRIVGL